MSCKAILNKAAAFSGALALCTVSSAQLSATKNVAKVTKQPGGTFRQLVGPDYVAPMFGIGTNCECTWENGVATDPIDGQSSETGTSVEDTFTADDFCLKEGYVYEIDCIYVQMISNSDPDEVDARLTVHYDCDGCPGDVVDCGRFSEPTIEDSTDLPGGFTLYTFKFDTGPRESVDEYGNIVEYDGLWLKGGCYWVSPVGIGDGSEYDNYFWAASGDNLIGSVAKTSADEDFKVPECTPVSDINVDCRNFAFSVCATPCCIVCDNGGPDLNGSVYRDNAVDTTGVDCRNADNVVINPCADIDLCFLSAYIWTNCDCTRTKLEVHEDDCGEVGEAITDEILVTKCIDLGRTITFDDQELTLYRVEFHDLDEVGINLSGGDNYWLSLHVQGTGSLNERGFWAFNYDCNDTDCNVKISPAQYICPGNRILDWTEHDDLDHAFCLAGYDNNANSGGTGGAGATTTCAADYNGDEVHNIADLLSFLDVYFDGCDE